MSRQLGYTSSFIELSARERAKAVLDEGVFRELLDPFQRMESPHLAVQGIVPQSDDGVVAAKGTIDGEPAVLVSVDGRFQGGGIGEISGAKIAGALELALRDNEAGIPTRAVLLLETGGVRLQEGNYGLLAIAEIHAAIVALRRYHPVVCVIAGMIGCFGGMSIAAGLCSAIIMTKQGRLQLNGPEVIEQEAGIEELDSRNRRLIWSMSGGEQRHAIGLADRLVDDDWEEIRDAVRGVYRIRESHSSRSSQVDRFLCRLSKLDTIEAKERLTPDALRSLWGRSDHPERDSVLSSIAQELGAGEGMKNSRGRIFFERLTQSHERVPTGTPSVLSADSRLGQERVRMIAVVPDAGNRFYRARNGEVGLDEGWRIADCVRRAVEEDKDRDKRAIVAIVDVPGQAYGYTEELLGIHQSCAAAADAYATARLAGHPVVALVVGHAISGAFLAHGLQANRIIALDDAGVIVQVMSKQSAARVTRRRVEELDETACSIAATAYDVQSFATLGALHQMLEGIDPDLPTSGDIEAIESALLTAIADARQSPADLSSRLQSVQAQTSRSLSILVRTKLAEQWN
ncbi:Acetyl-coenzyme A carboxylase carboxyl transferase subunit beta, chloroplastic [Paenibacillus solanacearum]|uniref:Acetyl-coenzyme A carboxylase carboxyl transferase subunit beta, chloroplastic n=1 Tax=Paenibacillus solanacearum TaxID=2048548 RepID=A0A916JZ29_9BACL|nr:biotin-independent malonate decarboxylase subunit beta [Paenibacillus solanacearum]CAG7609317.1 Acetyl-coenzyme A carboxylase carboxyl transferase subunit beta, chloroplastic [Paenibacillus solanacearum]